MDDITDLSDLTGYERTLVNAFALWGMRLMRGGVYFLVALALAYINTYGLTHVFLLSLAIGALGVGAATARLSLAAVACLLVMAVIPLTVVEKVVSAVV